MRSTYVDAAYSIKNKLRMASIRNRAGQYTLPGLKNVAAALSTLPKKVTQLSQLKIVDPPKAAGKARLPDLDLHLRDRPDELG